MGIFYNFILNDPILITFLYYLKSENEIEHKIIGIEDSSETLLNILEVHKDYMNEHHIMFLVELKRLINTDEMTLSLPKFSKSPNLD